MPTKSALVDLWPPNDLELFFRVSLTIFGTWSQKMFMGRFSVLVTIPLIIYTQSAITVAFIKKKACLLDSKFCYIITWHNFRQWRSDSRRRQQLSTTRLEGFIMGGRYEGCWVCSQSATQEPRHSVTWTDPCLWLVPDSGGGCGWWKS